MNFPGHLHVDSFSITRLPVEEGNILPGTKAEAWETSLFKKKLCIPRSHTHTHTVPNKASPQQKTPTSSLPEGNSESVNYLSSEVLGHPARSSVSVWSGAQRLALVISDQCDLTSFCLAVSLFFGSGLEEYTVT